jgi:hypothetical protein
MLLFFKNKFKNLESQLVDDLSNYKIPTISTLTTSPLVQSEFETVISSTTNNNTNFTAFIAPQISPKPVCTYPIQVEDMFPFWLKNSSNGQSNLILMTKAYYDWLSCGVTGSSVSFLNLEKLIDVATTPDNLLKNKLFSYINSFPSEQIKTDTNPTGKVNPENVKNLLDNVRINLYTKKGTEDSFKLVLQSLFDITADKISISYPKRYVMRLNGGRFDWMRNESSNQEPYQNNTNGYNPQLVGSYLNHSIIQDNDLWQEYSYVLNISDLPADNYKEIVRPLVHPAGTKDFYNVRQDIFNNIFDSSSVSKYEIPIIKNYAMYSILTSSSPNVCDTCNDIATGVTGPPHVFPSWDDEISTKYYSGMTFGMINIGDFLRLTSISDNYPNDGISCTGC